jgi:polyferredoxin
MKKGATQMTAKATIRKYNTPRRIVQLLFFIFFSAIVFNLGNLPLVFPVLFTWGLKTNTVGDAFSAIQFMLTGWNTPGIIFPYLALASFLITGVLIGKALCGWICPFGFIQDLVGYIRRRQTDLSQRTHDTLIYIKYGILGVAALIITAYSAATILGEATGFSTALGIFAQAPFTALSPSEILFAGIPRVIMNFPFTTWTNLGSDILYQISILSPLFWVQFAILIIVLVFAIYVPRSWCRYLCPHGAIMAIMNRFSFLGLRREPFKCEKGTCRHCVQACPTRVPILDLPWEKFSHPECIYCMKCADACEHGAIKPTYP